MISLSADAGPIRVFVAASPAEWLPLTVLAYSIIKNSKVTVNVANIGSFNMPIPLPRSSANRPRTPFSFQRFLIPEICGFQGKAIYLDADMLVFGDIAGLWNTPLHEYDLQTVSAAYGQRRPQFSVMLIDCHRLKWRLPEIVAQLDSGKLDYSSLMYDMKVARKIGQDVPHAWNSLESFNPNDTMLLHYTDMHTQPWVAPGHPLNDLWVGYLRGAIDDGYISINQLSDQIRLRHVRPGLFVEVMGDRKLPITRLADALFCPPYLSLLSGARRIQCRVRHITRSLRV